MRWFGRRGGAPSELNSPPEEVPVGKTCAWCAEPFAADGSGFVMPSASTPEGHVALHYECQLRQVIGGLNHLRGNCLCCGGTEPPDPVWLTPRQAAVQAVAVWEKRGRSASDG